MSYTTFLYSLSQAVIQSETSSRMVSHETEGAWILTAGRDDVTFREWARSPLSLLATIWIGDWNAMVMYNLLIYHLRQIKRFTAYIATWTFLTLACPHLTDVDIWVRFRSIYDLLLIDDVYRVVETSIVGWKRSILSLILLRLIRSVANTVFDWIAARV